MKAILACFSTIRIPHLATGNAEVETGMQTRIGEIAQMMAAKDEGKKNKKKCGCLPNTVENMTPMQENVERLGARIGVLAIGVCIIVFIVGWAIGTKDPEYPENP